MTFGSVKSLLAAVERDDVAVDGTAEIARLFVPNRENAIVLTGRSNQANRRSGAAARKRVLS